MITPIETTYAGHRFRSRLEARWAVFFDRLGLEWEYEPQGYVVSGRPYLPDFRITLPTGERVFAEVKNADVGEHEGEHVDLCRALADGAELPVLLLTGIPAHRLYHQFTPGLSASSFTAAFFHDYGRKLTTADQYWFQTVELDEATGVLKFTHDERGLTESFGEGLVQAVTAARSARFEHGETP
ncbi:hypothetical protein [Herbidospora daliensis]|uniref:hypothetical protein n=1 Tax=Herbidospora daliensis TaxID=295585 RepID=UPI0007826EE3|nr:hypothetical protein [Herbidospora daliensis]